MLTSSQLCHFKEQGYVVIEDAVPEGMLEPLRAAANRVAEKTRRGEWPYKRKAGEDDVWGVNHLLHPDLGEPVFADYMASPVVIDVAADLLGLDEKVRFEKLQLELVNMLFNPTKRDFDVGWHRDLAPPDEGLAELQKQQYGVQWNTALYDEACLYIVPASHRRPGTAEERDIVRNRPKDPMPGQTAVALKAGQGVYYNNSLFHRGIYFKDQRRETLHCCMGSIDGTTLRRKFVYNLGLALAWMERPGFRETLPERLIPLYDNFMRMKPLSES